jgi:hypothetical protein
MSNEQTFSEQIDQLKETVKILPDDTAPDIIEDTARRLEKLNYAPPVIIPQATFLRLTKEALLGEIDNILTMPDQEACALAPDEPEKCQDLRIQFISVQIYYYKILSSLRQGDVDAWDEVDELYVHD